MKRRSFLQAVGGVLIAGLAPNIAAKLEPGPLRYQNTVSGLIAWFESVFDCETGPAKAFFYDANGAEVVYETFALYGKECGDLAKREMINAARAEFQNHIQRFPAIVGQKLYWRLPEKIVMRKESRYIGDNQRLKLRMRIAIPSLQSAITMATQATKLT